MSQLAEPKAAASAAAFSAADRTPETVAVCSMLRMAVGDEIVAVGIEDVREILQMTRLTPLPRTPDFVRGVMNLRGAVVPVIDLSARLARGPTVLGRRSCIVVVEYQAAPVGEEGDDADADADDSPLRATVMGLLVDAVFEVFDRDASEIETAPGLGTRIAPEFLRGMTRAAGELVGVLALSRLLAPRDLAAGIAGFQPQ